RSRGQSRVGVEIRPTPVPQVSSGILVAQDRAVAESAARGTAARAPMDAGAEFDRAARASDTPPAGLLAGPIADLFSPEVQLVDDRMFRNAILGFNGSRTGSTPRVGEWNRWKSSPTAVPPPPII